MSIHDTFVHDAGRAAYAAWGCCTTPQQVARFVEDTLRDKYAHEDTFRKLLADLIRCIDDNATYAPHSEALLRARSALKEE